MEPRVNHHLRSESNKDLLHENPSPMWPDTFHGLYEQSRLSPSNNVFTGLSPTSPRSGGFISEQGNFPRPSSAQGMATMEHEYSSRAPSRTPPMTIDTRVPNGTFPSFAGPMHQPSGYGSQNPMDARYHQYPQAMHQPQQMSYDPRLGGDLFAGNMEFMGQGDHPDHQAIPSHHRAASVDSYISRGDCYPYPQEMHSTGQYVNHGGVNPSYGQMGGSMYDREMHSSMNGPSVGGCRFFTSGFCSRGEHCNYDHILGPEAQQYLAEQSRHRMGHGSMNDSNLASRRARVSPEKKNHLGDTSRLQSLDQVVGQVYSMCKDQYGCRFLQKKLEEKEHSFEAVNIIFHEVYEHMVELMTDPFGNYLCQKLIEHCDEKQQLAIVQKVAPKLVEISRNMHGTRAVQKMIECLRTPSQVQLVVHALQSNVVTLIRDLNGNHVIQRCLNRLSYHDKQFIYDAVAGHCVEVATHRHGCCVIQRCIDSASESQKVRKNFSHY